MSTEYVIWGIPQGASDETLLVSESAGLKSMDHAKRVMAWLAKEKGCTACRVQVIDFADDGSQLANAFRNGVRKG
jgi:hypothetical protein